MLEVNRAGITFSALGKMGRLGNQLFQIAAILSLGSRSKHHVVFPDWEFENAFKHPLPKGQLINATLLREKEFCFHDWGLRDDVSYDLHGYFQTEKYFDLELVRRQFDFSDAVKNRVTSDYQKALVKPILISVRRGDFVGNPHFHQLSVEYYKQALFTNFLDWEQRNLIVTSDDIDWIKWNFADLENAVFPLNSNPIDQLCLGSLCDDFIISNSTFSWWQCWLGEKRSSKVIRPIKNLIYINDCDYFPARWTSFEPEN